MFAGEEQDAMRQLLCEKRITMLARTTYNQDCNICSQREKHSIIGVFLRRREEKAWFPAATQLTCTTCGQDFSVCRESRIQAWPALRITETAAYVKQDESKIDMHYTEYRYRAIKDHVKKLGVDPVCKQHLLYHARKLYQ